MIETPLTHARDFVLRNARLLERRAFASHFDNGSSSQVLVALTACQNPDGGFGAALEPDKRDPGSQPVDVQFAFELLDAVGNFDVTIVGRACDWLETVSTAEGGVPFSLPSLNAFPHAPWWTAEAHPSANLNPTAAIVAQLFKYNVNHSWRPRAEAFCWAALERSKSTEFHELMPTLAFLKHVPDRQRAEGAMEMLLALIASPGIVELDPAKAGYVKMPLDWAPFPDSPCRRLFPNKVIAEHLSALAARQQSDGGWPISWDALSPGVALEWRGVQTVQALRTLRAYGALS